MLDVGFPDGASASAVFRPYSWLRADLGGSYNLVSKGVRGGVSVVPFGMGPSATLEAGHYFDGNANGIARNVVGAAQQRHPSAGRLDFANPTWEGLRMRRCFSPRGSLPAHCPQRQRR